mgnify:CR=1 FL=1
MRTIKTGLILLLAVMLLVGCSDKPGNGGTTGTVSLEAITTKVKETYGDDYLPSMDIDEVTLKDVMGIDVANIKDFKGQLPMMSTHVDTFLAIEANEGKGDFVAAELTAYRESLISSAMMYPMNIAKVQASEIVQQGDYVFFVMLGAYADGSEEDEIEFAKAETKKGVDVINSFFE